MQKPIKLQRPVYFLSSAAVGGFEEGRGPLGGKFDHLDTTDRFGMDTWEKAEGESERLALNFALSKAGIGGESLDFLLSGDLQNQCMASACGLYSFGVPYIGLYAACSTSAEGLMLLSALLGNGSGRLGAVVTSSHNAAAERQFRTPLEYGGQRAESSQWTATAAGAFILSADRDLCKNDRTRVKITEVMPGKLIDGAISDGANMGAAMAPSAAETVRAYFKESGADPRDFDCIVTGDLGRVGSTLLHRLLSEEFPAFAEKHRDCGLLLYSEKQDVHSGASGCGCSAAVMATHFLPALRERQMRRILFLATGAFMSPSSVAQKEHIFGIAPLVRIESEDIG